MYSFEGCYEKLTYGILIWLDPVVCFWNSRQQFLFPVGSLQIEWAGNKTLPHNIIPSVFSPKGGDAVTQYRRGVRFCPVEGHRLCIRGVVGGDGKRAPPLLHGAKRRGVTRIYKQNSTTAFLDASVKKIILTVSCLLVILLTKLALHY